MWRKRFDVICTSRYIQRWENACNNKTGKKNALPYEMPSEKQRFPCDSVRASHWSFTKNSQQQKCGHNITFQCWMKSNREIAWDGENERLRELNKRWRWIFRCCYCKVAFSMCTSFIYRIVVVAVAAAAEASSLLGWLVSCDRINRFCKRSFSTAIIRIFVDV